MSPAGGLTVALETSSRRPSVAAQSDGRRLERALEGRRAHASDLLPGLAALLGELGAGPGDIEAVIVGTGPGSYTGLRVGIATAQGIARGAGAELYGLSSLQALAWDKLQPGQSAAFLLDARAGELYLARYLRAPEQVETLLAPCITTRGELPHLLVPTERVVADADALAAAGLEPERGRDPQRFELEATPGAGALLELGRLERTRGAPHAPESVAPQYLRAFAARARKR